MSTKIINVPNGNNTPTTTAEILIENKIDYTPKVSVIIPVYNVEKYLRQCLDSVVNQTLKEIEIICIDDGSTDSSLEILKEYAEKDPRFTILTQENLYSGIARNAGLSIAKGEYLWFIDSDDFIELNAIELINNNNKDNDIILIGYRNITDNKIKENLSHCYLDYKIEKDIRKNAFKAQATIWCKIYKRDFILKQNIRFDNFKVCNDVYFAYYSMIVAQDITSIPQCLYNYRKDAIGALSRTRGEKSHYIVYAFNNIKQNLINKNLFNGYKKILLKQYIQHIDYELNNCSNFQQKIKLIRKLSFSEKMRFFLYKAQKAPFRIKYKEKKLQITILGIKTKINNPFTITKKSYTIFL